MESMGAGVRGVSPGLARNSDELIEINQEGEEETYFYWTELDDQWTSIAWWVDSPIMGVTEIGPIMKEIG